MKYEQEIISLQESKKASEEEYKLQSSKIQQDIQQKEMDLKMIKM